MKNPLAVLCLCAAPLLAQAQAQNCTGDNADGNYILGEAEGTASAMHWPTGLVWKRCLEGMAFNSATGQCTGTPTSNPWQNWAADYLPKYFDDSGSSYPHGRPSNHDLLASGAWRMAYKNELLGITQSCGNSPKVNRTVFPNTPFSGADIEGYVWSGSPYAGYSSSAWDVHFYDGEAYGNVRRNAYHVRLVRAGQSFASLNASPITQNAAAGAAAVGFTTTITLASAAGTTAWGGVRFQNGSSGNPQLQVNSGAWVTEAIVKTGDTIAVRMDAPVSGSRTATLEVRSGQTTGTPNAPAFGSELTELKQTTATFTLNAIENGTCGSAHNPAAVPLLASVPTANLCNAGAASPVTGGDEKWSWTCDGRHGGTGESCEAPRGYTVTPMVQGTGGSIDPDAPQTVAYGTTVHFHIALQPYHDATASGCGGNHLPSLFTTAAVTADCAVEVTFTSTPGQCGSAHGGTFATAPSANLCDAGTPSPVTGGAAWTWSCAAATTANCSASVTTHAITTSADPADAGRVACAPNPVPAGGSATCKALSNAYRLAEWAGNCAGQSGPVCTLTGVTAPSAATARFDTNAPIPGPLNDTGALACDASGPATQDCHHGRDAGAATGQLTKAGASSDARNGFDFTKISSSGAELQADAADWACTRDNLTGLVWEVKTIANRDAAYTWHDPHSPDGAPGAPGTGTASFAAAVNATGLCGATDWRLPTVPELAGLLDLGRAAPAALIDPGYFPRSAAAGYWTRTPFAGDTSQAWQVDFASGAARPAPRSGALRVRLVRGGQ